ncbi:Lipase maturation factor 2 isoform 2 [Schistosoma japonicum]|uniref:Lipase maturation factor n=2 Tax=Schistosoma japonicum TaxID=6182 RepID=A0A4Z2DCZ9_SCHJA|nr:Lipase maturation factor 2 isoform 2 [Schistosoma japonicum]
MGRVDVSIPKERFLLCLSFIYLFAFASLYIQLPGLYSEKGVTPVQTLTLNVPKDASDLVKNLNLLRFAEFLQLDVYMCLELVTVVGIVLSFLSSFTSAFRIGPVFLALWLLYLSVVKVGQTFLWFQWDILLLESGFIAILLSSFGTLISLPRVVASDKIGMWLLRWLLFRLMFSSGVVKLISDCPTWWNLEALHWHYQSQCIPTPLAWYAHHLPGWFHNLCVAGTFVIEIPMTFLFFMPFRTTRLASFYSQVLLQLAIILTGNYNFFNLLTIALCYSLLKDDDFNSRRRRKWTVSGSLSFVISWVLIISIFVISAYLFEFSISNNSITSSVGFTKKEFTWFLNTSVKYSIYFGVAFFFVEVLHSIVVALYARRFWRKLYELVGVIVISFIGLAVLMSSLVPFASLNPTIQLPSQNLQVYKHLQPYYITNSYGLFRRMTGVGGRPELILEAASNLNGPWSEYAFNFKPGRVDGRPPVVIPHQPRLDWQMWFAALSNYRNHPWFMNLIYRLLNQQPEVLQLLDPSGLPNNPKYIRAHLYTYHFTDSANSKDWWKRTFKSEYLPPVSLSSEILRSSIQENGLVGKRHPRPHDPTILSLSLSRLRSFVGQPKDLSPLVMVCLVLAITKFAVNQADQSTRTTYHHNRA